VTTYRCRAIAPHELPWCEVEASSPEDAVQAYQDRLATCQQVVVMFDEPDGARCAAHLALVEVEGHGEMVSRMFHKGLWRRGGVPLRPLAERLAEAARTLRWTHDPAELVAPGWDGEGEVWA
jgi:hypothetical protein